MRDLFGFDDPPMLITALLHDTIEDTTTDYDDVEKHFGAEIAAWVAYLTKDKRLPDDERERVYLERLKAAPWQVQVCKLADLYDNLTDVSQLPSERQEQARIRYEHYFTELCKGAVPEMQTAIALVQELVLAGRASDG